MILRYLDVIVLPEKNLVQYFRPIVDYFHDFDLVIVNLEAPFALNERPLIDSLQQLNHILKHRIITEHRDYSC